MKNIFSFLRLGYLISLKYSQRHYLKVLFGIVIVIFLAIVQNKISLLYLNSNILSEGLIGTYQEHDLPQEIMNLLSESLVKPDNHGRMTANLASDWQVNNDATIFTFKLKNDLYWTDGTKIKSSDLDFPIPNVEVRYPDDETIEFKLKEAYSPFPSLLTKPIVKRGTLIGIGPYKISKIEKSRIFITKIVLEPTQGDLPHMVIRLYPNEKTAWVGFALGEVQSLFGVNQTALKSEYPLARIKQEVDYSKIVTVLYDTADPVLANRSLRQALSYSAPKIEDEVHALSPIVPFSWAYLPEVKSYLSNNESAKSALERAKTTSNEDDLKKELVLTTIPQLEDVGRKIVAAWRNLGINAVLRTESGIPQKFQALLIVQSIPVDPDQYFLWHKTQTKTNITKYDKARVDKDLEDGRKLIKESDRKEKYADFQKILSEDAPATFLYFPKYNIIYLEKVSDKLEKVFLLQFTKLGS